MAITPPPRDDISGSGSTPSSGVARAGFGKMWDWLTSLLGQTGTPAEVRSLLGIGPVISFRNLLINGNFAINQRGYVSGVATTGANQYTLDRWRIVTSGQNATFAAAAPNRTVTFPAGGGEQVIEGGAIVGGVYTLSWTGAATAKVNGVAIANGGNTSSLTANTNVTIQFIGPVGEAQFELGTVATPFERRFPGAELALCQRYYETGISSASLYSTSSTVPVVRVKFSVTKRAAPTVVLSGIGEANANGTAAVSPTVDSFTHTYAVTATGVGTSTATWAAAAEL